MKVAAILLDTCRELLYRKTLWIYSGIVSLTLLFFLLALQTDVAGGVIASLKVFGLEGHASGGGFTLDSQQGGGSAGLTAASFVQGIQIAVAFVLYPLGIMLSVFATAGLVPSLLERGLIDLLLSKPVSRPMLFLSRFLGAVLVAAVNLIYLVGGLGLILGIKTGVWNPGFLLSGLAMALYFACLLGFVALFGVLFRSSAVSIMMTAVIFVASLIVRWPHQNADWPRLITGRAARFVAQGLVETLYYALPRTYDFGQIVAALILGRGTASLGAMLGSALAGGAALAVATYYFSRIDF